MYFPEDHRVHNLLTTLWHQGIHRSVIRSSMENAGLLSPVMGVFLSVLPSYRPGKWRVCFTNDFGGNHGPC